MTNIDGVCPSGIYTKEQIDYVNSVKEEDLRDHLLHLVRLRDNSSNSNLYYENKINTLENIILDMREQYPNLKIPTMKETAEKHGELPSYIKKYKNK